MRRSQTQNDVTHPWSPEKQTVSDNYKVAAVQHRIMQALEWAVYFEKDVAELNKLLQVGAGEQHDFNKIFQDSMQNCINNLNAGQPRQQAIDDLIKLLDHVRSIDPWQPSK